MATPSNNPAAAGSNSLTVPGATGASGSATPRTGSYAGALKAPATDWHLEFSFNGKKLDLNETIYGLVHRNRASLPGGVGSGGAYGGHITLVWKKADGPGPSGTSCIHQRRVELLCAY